MISFLIAWVLERVISSWGSESLPRDRFRYTPPERTREPEIEHYLINKGNGVEVVSGYLRDDGLLLPLSMGQRDSEVWAFLRHEFDGGIRPVIIRRVANEFTMEKGNIILRDYTPERGA